MYYVLFPVSESISKFLSMFVFVQAVKISTQSTLVQVHPLQMGEC